MFRKTITYENFNGEKKTKDVYFHLNKIECRKLETEIEGGLIGALDTIISNRDVSAMYDLVGFLVLESYGERTQDGESFIKDENIKKHFKCSNVYEAVMDEFTNNPAEIGSFLTGIIPGANKAANGSIDRIEDLKARIAALENKDA